MKKMLQVSTKIYVKLYHFDFIYLLLVEYFRLSFTLQMFFLKDHHKFITKKKKSRFGFKS